jgi:hypothetical protein
MHFRTVVSPWWYRCTKCVTLNSSATAKCAYGGAIQAAGQEVIDNAGERVLWVFLTLGVSELAKALTTKDPVMYFTSCAACGQKHPKVACHACGTEHHTPVFTIGDPPAK